MENQKRTNNQKRMTCKKGTRAKARKRAKRIRMLKRLGKRIGIVVGAGTLVISGYKGVGIVKDQISKRLEWLQNSNIRTEETVQAQELPKQEDILDEILELYNSGLSEEQQIDEQDIGIWEEQHLNNGQVYRDEEGNYIRNSFITLNEEENNIQWIDGEEIKDFITVFDKENRKTITGMALIDGEYTSVEVDKFKYELNQEAPYTKAENYVTLEGNEEENFRKLRQKVQERSQSKTNQQEQADDGSR